MHTRKHTSINTNAKKCIQNIPSNELYMFKLKIVFIKIDFAFFTNRQLLLDRHFDRLQIINVMQYRRKCNKNLSRWLKTKYMYGTHYPISRCSSKKRCYVFSALLFILLASLRIHEKWRMPSIRAVLLFHQN